MKILWMSRHRPLSSQVVELKHHFGEGVVVEQDPRPFDNAEVVARRFKEGGFDDMVVVAPLSVIDHLCRMGLKPLWAEMIEETDPRKIEVRARNTGYRFSRFRRVKSVRLEFEEL